ncbi:hypothetical protein, partial [Pantoea dispersa]|uniref:hypothetical protein n=1 Tax=Pantoea dispersa TaxID=59814 RepID=UPI001C047295
LQHFGKRLKFFFSFASPDEIIIDGHYCPGAVSRLIHNRISVPINVKNKLTREKILIETRAALRAKSDNYLVVNMLPK